jgi:hypothetical protein
MPGISPRQMALLWRVRLRMAFFSRELFRAKDPI